jgi:hypothetical protein
MKEAARYVDDELIDALAVTGSIKDCNEGIRRLRRAGVTQPIPIPINSEMFMQVISALT